MWFNSGIGNLKTKTAAPLRTVLIDLVRIDRLLVSSTNLQYRSKR